MNSNNYLLMYFSFVIYAFSGVFLKIASFYKFLSLKYCFFFGLAVFVLGLYAILWQQVLKKIELSIAMANKPFVLVLGIVLACLLFKEQLTIRLVIGCLLILFGISIIGRKHE